MCVAYFKTSRLARLPSVMTRSAKQQHLASHIMLHQMPASAYAHGVGLCVSPRRPAEVLMAPHLYGHPHAQARAIEAARSNVETHYAYICVQVEEFQRRQGPLRWLSWWLRSSGA